MTLEEQQSAKRRLRHIGHVICIAFATLVYPAVFLITGDVNLAYALIAVTGFGLAVWLVALWYFEDHHSLGNPAVVLASPA